MRGLAILRLILCSFLTMSEPEVWEGVETGRIPIVSFIAAKTCCQQESPLTCKWPTSDPLPPLSSAMAPSDLASG